MAMITLRTICRHEALVQLDGAYQSGLHLRAAFALVVPKETSDLI